MKFEIGDKVTVLHSNEEAEVVEMINDRMVMVEVRGVKFPPISISWIFPISKDLRRKKPNRKKKQKLLSISCLWINPEKRQSPGWMLVKDPAVSDTDEFGDEVVESLKIYLVNHTERGMKFQYKLSYTGKPDFEISNELPASERFLPARYSFRKSERCPASCF